MISFLLTLIVGPISGQVLTTSAPFSCPPDALGPFAIPGQCVREYYVCFMGNAVPQTCPGAWLFDPVILACAPPDAVSCLQTTSPAASSPAPPPFVCPPQATGAFPSSDQCVRLFYFCLDGALSVQTCPGTTLFDPLTLRCSPPDECLAASSSQEPATSAQPSAATDATTASSSTGTGAGSRAAGSWTLALSASLALLHLVHLLLV